MLLLRLVTSALDSVRIVGDVDLASLPFVSPPASFDAYGAAEPDTRVYLDNSLSGLLAQVQHPCVVLVGAFSSSSVTPFGRAVLLRRPVDVRFISGDRNRVRSGVLSLINVN